MSEINGENNLGHENNSMSKCLLILNLQRPFVTNSLDSLLIGYGKVERFWLDYINSHCYVEVRKF